MTASSFRDTVVEAAAVDLWVTRGNDDGTRSILAKTSCEVADEVLAAAVPLLLAEAERRIEAGMRAMLDGARGTDSERYAAIKAEGIRLALGTFRELAKELGTDE